MRLHCTHSDDSITGQKITEFSQYVFFTTNCDYICITIPESLEKERFKFTNFRPNSLHEIHEKVTCRENCPVHWFLPLVSKYYITVNLLNRLGPPLVSKYLSVQAYNTQRRDFSDLKH